MTTRFAEEQIGKGESVFTCGHVEHDRHHVFRMSGTLKTVSPAGRRVASRWFICCHDCLLANGGRTAMLEMMSSARRTARMIRGDGVWTGDEPSLTVPPEQEN